MTLLGILQPQAPQSCPNLPGAIWELHSHKTAVQKSYRAYNSMSSDLGLLAYFTLNTLFGIKKINKTNRVRGLGVIDTSLETHIAFLIFSADFTLHQAMPIRKTWTTPSSFSDRLASFWVSHMMILKVPNIPKDLAWVASASKSVLTITNFGELDMNFYHSEQVFCLPIIDLYHCSLDA